MVYTFPPPKVTPSDTSITFGSGKVVGSDLQHLRLGACDSFGLPNGMDT
jgi:hypothetical protein